VKESGSVSIILVAIVSMTAVLIPAFMDMGSIVTARARAHSAADAAALAAAQEMARGGDAEDSAGKYASLNGAELTAISVDEESATVSVTVNPGRLYVERFGIPAVSVQGRGKAEVIWLGDKDY
jgi:secretion/DNA translocation related TadE-like protein